MNLGTEPLIRDFPNDELEKLIWYYWHRWHKFSRADQEDVLQSGILGALEAERSYTEDMDISYRSYVARLIGRYMDRVTHPLKRHDERCQLWGLDLKTMDEERFLGEDSYDALYLDETLKALDARDQRILLHKLAGYENVEIADLEGITPQAISYRINTLPKRLAA